MKQNIDTLRVTLLDPFLTNLKDNMETGEVLSRRVESSARTIVKYHLENRFDQLWWMLYEEYIHESE